MLMQVRSLVCLAVACFLVCGGVSFAVQSAEDEASAKQGEQATDEDANVEKPGEKAPEKDPLNHIQYLSSYS